MNRAINTIPTVGHSALTEFASHPEKASISHGVTAFSTSNAALKLRPHGLTLCPLLGLTICKTCKHAVPPSSWRAHPAKHGLPSVPQETEKIVQSAFATVSTHPQRQTYLDAAKGDFPKLVANGHLQLLDPVGGIHVHAAGYKCLHCDDYYCPGDALGREAIRKHLVKKHQGRDICENGLLLGRDFVAVGPVQSIFLSPRHCFPVISSPFAPLNFPPLPKRNLESSDSSLNIFEKEFENTFEGAFLHAVEKLTFAYAPGGSASSSASKSSSSDSNIRQVNYFIHATHLDKLMSTHSPEKAIRAAASAEKEDRRVVDAIMQYLRRAAELLEDTPPAVKRKIGGLQRKRNIGEQSQVTLPPEFQATTEKTQQKYACVVARAVLMVLRIANEDDLSCLPRPPTRLTSDAISFGQAVKRDFPFNQLGIPFSSTATFFCLHRVLHSLFLSALPEYESPSKLYLRWFIVFSSLSLDDPDSPDDFRFCEAKDVSPRLAALLFALRCTALIELKASCKDAVEYSARSSHVYSCLELSKNNVYALIKDYLNKALHAQSLTPPPPRLHYCLNHPENSCAIIDGHELTTSKLGKAVERLCELSFKVLTKDIMKGMPLPISLLNALPKLEDRVQNRQVGYSFLQNLSRDTEKNQTLERFAGMLTKHFLLDKSIRGQLFNIPETFRIDENPDCSKWRSFLRPEAANAWLKSCRRFQDLLIALLLICGGAPPRATEMITHKIRNTHASFRTIYLVKGRVLLLLRYNKTNSLIKGDRVIPRPLDREAGDLLKMYILVVRPLESAITGFLYGAKAGRMQRDYLFVFQGNPLQEDHARTVIKDSFSKAGIPLTISQYRQWNAAIMQRNIKVALTNVLVDEQAGHSEATAERFYGKFNCDVDVLAASKLRQSFDITDQFLALIGRTQSGNDFQSSLYTPSGGKCSPLGLSGQSRKQLSVPSSQASTPPSQCSCSRSCGIASVDDLVSAVRKKLFESGEILCKRSFQNFTMHRGIDQQNSKRLRTCLTTSASRFFVNSHPAPLLENLKWRPFLESFLHMKGANFRSEAQQAALTALLESKMDMLVVLPTSGGKSLLYILAAFIEIIQGKNLVTVVIVPLRALVDDIKKRCTEAGIPTGTWKDRQNTNCRILVFAIEHVATEDYAKFYATLVHEERLSRLVVDEVHLTVIWNPFRKSLLSLALNLRPVESETPLLLLSATVPPCSENIIRSHLGASNIHVIRTPTVRANLAYRVLYQENSPGQRTEVTMREAVCKIIQREVGQFQSFERILVFCVTRWEAKNVHARLSTLFGEGRVLLFHGGLSTQEKTAVYHNWSPIDSVVRIMVATSAFGTGLDFKYIRIVLHVGFSRSLVEYAQESGRAGRDGRPSKCILVHSTSYVKKFTEDALRASDEWSGGEFDQTMPLSKVQGRHIASYNNFHLSGIQEFTSWAQDATACKRQKLQIHLDGEGQLCVFTPGAELCSTCFNGSIRDSPGESWEAPDDFQPHQFSLGQLPDPKTATREGNFDHSWKVSSSRQIQSRKTSNATSSSNVESLPFAKFNNLSSESIDNCSFFSQPSGSQKQQELDSTQGSIIQKVTRRNVQNLIHAKNEIDEFKKHCSELAHITCIPCYVEGTLPEDHEPGKCQHVGSRCSICFQHGHWKRHCYQNTSSDEQKIQPHHSGLRPVKVGFCYKCQLPKVYISKVLHGHNREGEEAPRFGLCLWQHGFKLCLYLWAKKSDWVLRRFPELQQWVNSPVSLFQDWLTSEKSEPYSMIIMCNKWMK